MVDAMPRFKRTGFRPRHPLQQREVLHVARADLKHVRVLGDQVHVFRLQTSVTTPRPVASRACASNRQTSLPMPGTRTATCGA